MLHTDLPRLSPSGVGITLLDTGDYYDTGHNELLIGQARRDRRDKAILSMKFGALRGPDGPWLGMDTRPASVRNFLAYTRAAAYAAALAKGLGASVHLVHILEEPSITGDAWHLPRAHKSVRREQLYHDSRARLAALAAATLEYATDRIAIEVRTGTPAEAIVEAATAYGVDLIVMSAPAHGRLPHLVMESVAERVLRAAPCPVLAVRRSGAAHLSDGKRAA
jgi:nucleotide-binding universal stress UspA family protein